MSNNIELGEPARGREISPSKGSLALGFFLSLVCGLGWIVAYVLYRRYQQDRYPDKVKGLRIGFLIGFSLELFLFLVYLLLVYLLLSGIK